MHDDDSPQMLTDPAELQKALDESRQKAQDYWERLLRMQAENDNALRRTERDVANAHKYALEKFVTELLPIMDSLELSLSRTAPEFREAASSVLEGVDLTLKMFCAALEKFGVRQVNPVNQAFDPEHQQAISMQYDPEVKPGMVLSVLQKGYTLNERLLRPALVVVSTAEE